MPTSTDVAGIKRPLENCFSLASKLSLKKISIPAIGTAAFGISAQNSAKLVMETAKRFSRSNYSLQVCVVVFEASMMHDFEDAVILQKEENQSEILVTEARLCRAKTGNMQLYIELPCNRKICSLQHYANVNNNNNNNKTNKQTNKTTMKKTTRTTIHAIYIVVIVVYFVVVFVSVVTWLKNVSLSKAISKVQNNEYKIE